MFVVGAQFPLAPLALRTSVGHFPVPARVRTFDTVAARARFSDDARALIPCSFLRGWHRTTVSELLPGAFSNNSEYVQEQSSQAAVASRRQTISAIQSGAQRVTHLFRLGGALR